MKIQKTIWKETLHIAVGLLVGDALMIAVYAVFRRMSLPVLWAALYSSFFTVLSFFLMGVSVQKALDMESGQKAYVQRSYTLRMLLCVAAIIVGIALLELPKIAVIVPFLLPKPIIYAMQLLGLYKPESKAASDHSEKGGDTES